MLDVHFTFSGVAMLCESSLRCWRVAALLLVTACVNPEQPPTVTMVSLGLGLISLEWLTSSRASVLDASATLRLTPLSYSDLDDISAGVRYLTVAFLAENRSAGPLEHLTLRAIAAPGGVGGTALTEIRGFPSAQWPEGEPITDAGAAARFLPRQATVLLAAPSSDPTNSDFQGYSASESAALTVSARGLGMLTPDERVLDYGFVVRDSAGTGRRLEAGASGRVSVAFALPRSFAGLPKPYRFKLSFLLTTDDRPRVTRALGETTQAAQTRATALGSAANPAQLALFGADRDAPSDPRFAVFRIDAPRIGLEPVVALEGAP